MTLRITEKKNRIRQKPIKTKTARNLLASSSNPPPSSSNFPSSSSNRPSEKRLAPFAGVSRHCSITHLYTRQLRSPALITTVNLAAGQRKMAYHQPFDPYYVYNPHSLPLPLPQFADEPRAINTLFVSGLPDDVKAREIHNLFWRRPGFESCQLKYTGRGDQDVKFDPQTGSTLHIELARLNSRRKERPGSGPYVVIDNRNKEPSKSHDEQSDEGESDPDEAQEPGNGDSPKENDNSKRCLKSRSPREI